MSGVSGMISTEGPTLRLVGNWRAALRSEEGKFSYFRIMRDRRVFGVEPWVRGNGKLAYCEFRMLAENLTETDFTLRFAGKEGSSVRRYFFDGEMLVLSADGTEGELRWHCSRVADEELPEYFEPEYAKAMEKPWS
jgi:hypothetical protein